VSGELLDRQLLGEDALTVAPRLLGQLLVRGEVVLRITEVEAHCGPEDSAAHTARGRTRRNEPMWGPPGRAYVYLCYGLHNMLNVVCGPEDVGHACLIRACEPVAGLDRIRSRRGGKEGPVLLTGPGKVGAALDLDRAWSGHDLCSPGGLELRAGGPAAGILRGPRVGIDYALPAHRDAPWRLALAGTRWVSRRSSLR
jgi:DNA-3-methyladenine glycosylase